MPRRGGIGVALLTVAVLATSGLIAVPVAAQSTPTVTRAEGGNGPNIAGTPIDLPDLGYVGAEYLVEGTAESYAPAGTFGPDGRWEVTADATAPYKTRILVSRPERARDFNGTVFVEWMNVSAGFDVAIDWTGAHTEIIRRGAAYVGVSAQAIGVQGGGAIVGGSSTGGGIKGADPARYGSLTHPGDAFSYDIFTQAGQVARGAAELDPLGDLKVRRVIAMGESQSAGRLVTYVNAVHRTVDVFDGFLIHSRGPSGASLGTAMRGVPDPVLPAYSVIRPDVGAPVLNLQTETDILRFLPARQRDAKRFRLWEAAGTAHVDAYTTGLGIADVADDGSAQRTLLDMTQLDGGPLACGTPINAGPGYAVLNAAAFALERWVRDGTPPPKAKRLEVLEGATTTYQRDEHGLVLGGIRTPLVDAPIATYTGNPNPGGPFCTLYGTTTPFDAATLGELYASHDDYVERFSAASEEAVDAGFLRPEDAEHLNAAADATAVPA